MLGNSLMAILLQATVLLTAFTGCNLLPDPRGEPSRGVVKLCVGYHHKGRFLLQRGCFYQPYA